MQLRLLWLSLWIALNHSMSKAYCTNMTVNMSISCNRPLVDLKLNGRPCLSNSECISACCAKLMSGSSVCAITGLCEGTTSTTEKPTIPPTPTPTSTPSTRVFPPTPLPSTTQAKFVETPQLTPSPTKSTFSSSEPPIDKPDGKTTTVQPTTTTVKPTTTSIPSTQPPMPTPTLLPPYAPCTSDEMCEWNCCSKERGNEYLCIPGGLLCKANEQPPSPVQTGPNIGTVRPSTRPTSSPRSTPSNGAPTVETCTTSSECSSQCCAMSRTNIMQCVARDLGIECIDATDNSDVVIVTQINATTGVQESKPMLAPWADCSTNEQCQHKCCSIERSPSGVYACTPFGTPSKCTGKYNKSNTSVLQPTNGQCKLGIECSDLCCLPTTNKCSPYNQCFSVSNVTPKPNVSAPFERMAINQPNSSSSSGWIVAVATGGAALMGMIIAIIAVRRRRHQGKAVDVTITHHQSHTQSPSMSMPYIYHADSTVDEVEWSDLEVLRLNRTKLQRQHRLGKGGFGEVWLGIYDGNKKVAIKTMSDGLLSNPKAVQSFIHEVKLLARLENPFIVQFLGATWSKTNDVELVVEYMNQGDLREYLYRHTLKTFPWEAKIQCALDILHGLLYLHSHNIIHRDLKSRNILLDSNKPSKLSDFGVSREIHSKTMTQEVGTYLWAAPEILKGGRFTVVADIYSFGMVLSELDTHDVPFRGLTMEEGSEPLLEVAIMMKVMVGDIKPTLSPNCPVILSEIIQACTQYDAEHRPSIKTIIEALTRFQQSLSA